MIQTILTVLFFVTLTEALIEYLFGNTKELHAYLPLISLVIAVILTFFYNVNLLSLLLGIQTEVPFFDLLFSGFVIARLSNFLNDFVQKFLGSK